MKAKLITAIDSAHARVGDEIRATLDAGVRRKNDLILPKGAEVIGRIRRLERYSAPNPDFIFGLEFTDVLFTRDARKIDARFAAKLESYDTLPGMSQTGPAKVTEHQSFGPSNHIGFYSNRITTEQYATRELPGVGTFFVEGKQLHIKSGFGKV